jgi:hypothetical protein
LQSFPSLELLAKGLSRDGAIDAGSRHPLTSVQYAYLCSELKGTPFSRCDFILTLVLVGGDEGQYLSDTGEKKSFL